MKYCLSGRQPLSVLKKCDEVRMKYKDAGRMFDYMEQIPDKTFIFNIPATTLPEEIDWRLFNAFQEKVKIIFCIENLDLAQFCKSHKVDFYWAYNVTSFYELQGIVALGPSYVALGAPLSFSLSKVKAITKDIPLRLIVNLAQERYIPREDGIKGPWVRPEDIDKYAKYIDAVDFYHNEELTKESTLFHVYAENKKWPGNLNMLFTDFGVNVDNQVLPTDIGDMRMECGQRCMEGKNCNYCYNSIRLADILHKRYLNRTKETV